ncbi:MAG: phosphoserine phosphatase SerB [Arcanobacterium sp.]|nr:phosphoserine phosphatase SerB [Arcanobacterium sp.]
MSFHRFSLVTQDVNLSPAENKLQKVFLEHGSQPVWEKLRGYPFSAWSCLIEISDENNFPLTDDENFPLKVITVASEIGFIATHLSGELAHSGPKLIITDVDSTFIQQEVIELLAAHAGLEAEVKEITDAAMRGELDFRDSLRERVSVLAGLPESIFKDVFQQIKLTPGAQELVQIAHRQGAYIGLVSGGFTEILNPLLEQESLDFGRANQLEIHEGKLSGKTIGTIIDATAKVLALKEWSENLGITLAETVCAGDGANDLPMLEASGHGFAFCAKPIVAQNADTAITFQRLDIVTALCGWHGII